MAMYCKKSYLKVKLKRGGKVILHSTSVSTALWTYQRVQRTLKLGPTDEGWGHHFYHKEIKQGPPR